MSAIRKLSSQELKAMNEGTWWPGSYFDCYKGKLENPEYDYYFVPSTGSFVVAVKKGEEFSWPSEGGISPLYDDFKVDPDLDYGKIL